MSEVWRAEGFRLVYRAMAPQRSFSSFFSVFAKHNTERECGNCAAGKMAYMFISNAAVAVGQAPRSQMALLYQCTFDIEKLISTIHFRGQICAQSIDIHMNCKDA